LNPESAFAELDIFEDEFQDALRQSREEAEAKRAEERALEEFEQIRSVLSNPDALFAILAQFPDVDPRDPRFTTFMQSIS
jgi:ribosomal 50S subunit-associated protein YjgA (DUF615 family)